MLVEKFCYYAGVAVADCVMVSVFGQGGVMLYASINSIAKTHKIVTSSADAITNNLFECLPYID